MARASGSVETMAMHEGDIFHLKDVLGCRLELEYHGRSRGGKNGLTVWARLIAGTSVVPGLDVGVLAKIHICNALPCPSASYGPGKYHKECDKPLFHGILCQGDDVVDKEVVDAAPVEVAVAAPVQIPVAEVDGPRADVAPAHVFQAAPVEVPVAALLQVPVADVNASPVMSELEVMRLQLRNLACETTQPKVFTDLAVFLAIALLHRRLIILEMGERTVNFFEDFAPELLAELHDQTGLPPPEPMVVGLGRCEFNESTQCRQLKLIDGVAEMRQHIKSLHFFPVFGFPVVMGAAPPAPCDGRACGSASNCCHCVASHQFQRRGKVPWPVPADGDCFWHACMWWLGIDSQSDGGDGRRMDQRHMAAAFIMQQAAAMTVDSAWYKAVLRVQTWIEAPALVGEASALPQTPLPKATPGTPLQTPEKNGE